MKKTLFLCLLWLVFILSATVTRADKIVLVAGGGTNEISSLPLPATQVRLKEPFGVDFDAAGNLFIIEMTRGNRLLKMDKNGLLAHVAGAAITADAGDYGPLRQAQFNGPHNLAVIPNGNVLVADTWNGLIRCVDWNANQISAFTNFIVPLAQAKGAGPYCIALDFSGTRLYVADLHSIHVIDLVSGRARIFAGNGQRGKPADGAVASEAPLIDPRAVAPDRKGNVYILERSGHALRVVDREGKIRTVVNASGKPGANGDGGGALAAAMNGPNNLCVDLEDNVIIADAENHLVRKYIPATGIIVRVAGTGKRGAAGLGGPPELAELNRPHGVSVRKDGAIFITDSYNNRILKIAP